LGDHVMFNAWQDCGEDEGQVPRRANLNN
jgi:hypothetical protein